VTYQKKKKQQTREKDKKQSRRPKTTTEKQGNTLEMPAEERHFFSGTDATSHSGSNTGDGI